MQEPGVAENAFRTTTLPDTPIEFPQRSFFPEHAGELRISPGITQNCGDETKLYLVVSYKKQLAIMEIRVVHDARRPRLMLATLAFGDIGGAHSRKRG